ncbi:MAG: hypothetical protein MZV64_33670 [Ignavibacteriales bacterium]|nr:hypothetical protein [Ignavibacteriales bacterium]
MADALRRSRREPAAEIRRRPASRSSPWPSSSASATASTRSRPRSSSSPRPRSPRCIGLRPRLQVEGHGAGHRRQHPQGHAGHPDHALGRHPDRRLDGQRHHPHGHLLRPQAHLAAVLPGHGLPGLLGRGRSPPGPPGGRSARSAWPSSASPWASGIPLGPAAGAIVAGAYFGDKMSPLSDIPNLATVISGSNLFDHIKHMMWSAGAGLAGRAWSSTSSSAWKYGAAARPVGDARPRS